MSFQKLSSEVHWKQQSSSSLVWGLSSWAYLVYFQNTQMDIHLITWSCFFSLLLLCISVTPSLPTIRVHLEYNILTSLRHLILIPVRNVIQFSSTRTNIIITWQGGRLACGSLLGRTPFLWWPGRLHKPLGVNQDSERISFFHCEIPDVSAIYENVKVLNNTFYSFLEA